MLPKRIRKFLDKNHINYDTIRCEPTHTVSELATTANVPKTGLAKTVIAKSDGKFIMLVEPLEHKTDLNRWRELLGCNELVLANNAELNDLFDELEKNSIPGFGNIWDLDVLVDDSLGTSDEIAFNSGTPTELIKLSYKDYIKWVKPKLFHIH